MGRFALQLEYQRAPRVKQLLASQATAHFVLVYLPYDGLMWLALERVMKRDAKSSRPGYDASRVDVRRILLALTSAVSKRIGKICHKAADAPCIAAIVRHPRIAHED
jgi:hypothetical protein